MQLENRNRFLLQYRIIMHHYDQIVVDAVFPLDIKDIQRFIEVLRLVRRAESLIRFFSLPFRATTEQLPVLGSFNKPECQWERYAFIAW